MADAPFRQYHFETFRLDTRTRELLGEHGVAIPLAAKAFDTLRFLIENRQRIVAKDELLDSVWAGRVVEENNLTQAVSALRRALGSGAGDHRFVVTVPGRGYRFVAEVQETDGDVGALPPPEPIPWAGGDTPVSLASPVRRWLAVGALVVLLGLGAATAWQVRTAAPSAFPQRAQSTSIPPAAPASLAVLPFRSLTVGPRDELLELGLADILITRISDATTLRVRSLSSSQRFAGPRQDPLEAGRQLGARYVVEGTTQRNGDRVRVSARLLAVRDGAALWLAPSTNAWITFSPCRTGSPPPWPRPWN